MSRGAKFTSPKRRNKYVQYEDKVCPYINLRSLLIGSLWTKCYRSCSQTQSQYSHIGFVPPPVWWSVLIDNCCAPDWTKLLMWLHLYSITLQAHPSVECYWFTSSDSSFPDLRDSPGSVPPPPSPSNFDQFGFQGIVRKIVKTLELPTTPLPFPLTGNLGSAPAVVSIWGTDRQIIMYFLSYNEWHEVVKGEFLL